MMAHGCPDNVPTISATLHVQGDTQASLKWWFDPVTNGSVSIDKYGVMDFRAVQSPVLVTVTLQDENGSQAIFDHTGGFNVFGFNDADSDGYNGLKVMPQHGHKQFWQIDATDL